MTKIERMKDKKTWYAVAVLVVIVLTSNAVCEYGDSIQKPKITRMSDARLERGQILENQKEIMQQIKFIRKILQEERKYWQQMVKNLTNEIQVRDEIIRRRR